MSLKSGPWSHPSPVGAEERMGRETRGKGYTMEMTMWPQLHSEPVTNLLRSRPSFTVLRPLHGPCLLALSGLLTWHILILLFSAYLNPDIAVPLKIYFCHKVSLVTPAILSTILWVFDSYWLMLNHLSSHMFVSSLKLASKFHDSRYCVPCFFYDLKSARCLGAWDWHMHSTIL